MQEANAEPVFTRPLNIFFSYSSDNQPFVNGLLKHTQFRTILAAKIWDYRDRGIKVGELREGLRRSIAACDLFVAFIGGAYVQGSTTAFEFEEAIQMVTGGKSRLRDVIFVIVDADGHDWWNQRKKQGDIKKWRAEPVWIDCQNDQGTGPRNFDADASLVTRFNDLAKDLRARLQEGGQTGGAASTEPGR
jgi:TIR domain